MNFREWLLAETTVSKLAIFDFDSTLARTMHKPQGWKGTDYTAPDGRVRKGKESDWWSHPESLADDFAFNERIVAEFQKARSDPNTRAVMLTGRSGMRTAHIIRGKLRAQGLHGKRMISPHHSKALKRHQEWPHGDEHPDDSHEEFYSGDWNKAPDYPKSAKGNPMGDTFSHKSYVVKQLVDENITEIDFWDDREDHLPGFIALFQELLVQMPNLQRVTVHHVKDGVPESIPLRKPSQNPWQL
jgi:hypothetical protein